MRGNWTWEEDDAEEEGRSYRAAPAFAVVFGVAPPLWPELIGRLTSPCKIS